MAEGHRVRNSQFTNAIRDANSHFQVESLKIKNNQPVLTPTPIAERLWAALKISVNTDVRVRYIRAAIHQVRN
jgi:hypothetical protein